MLKPLHSYSSCVCGRYLFRKHKFCLNWNLLRRIICNLRRCNLFQKMQMKKFHIRHTHTCRCRPLQWRQFDWVHSAHITLVIPYMIWSNISCVHNMDSIYVRLTTKCDLFAQLTFSVKRFDLAYSPKQKNSGLN